MADIQYNQPKYPAPNEGIQPTTGFPNGGTNNPITDMYSTFVNSHEPFTTVPGDVSQSLNQNIWDNTGPAGRSQKGLQGPWVDPQALRGDDEYYKYNQMLMTVSQFFDPFMQKKELETPHWWFSRIPRTSYKLFDGTVHETRIYRGGLTTYAGLSQWEPINPVNDGSSDPCAPMKFDTYDYAWETLAWQGRRAAWGSDPICLDVFKFVPQAQQQLAWILETGARYGVDMQEVWNRDNFIYMSVRAGHSYVMTSEYNGVASPRYIYNPFVKFGKSNEEAEGVANSEYIDQPFIVFEAVDIEPLNFDVLDQVREDLKVQCPEAAVGRLGSSPMFALAISEDDVERYIRGNEEERKYWIEANPNALIQHYGFAPTTFRRWSITNDGNQLRFKLKRYIPSYTSEEALHYGNVGAKELANKAVWVAEYVPPRIGGRRGINGSLVPTVNPAYYKAEIAIAPIFMNKIFTNQFVPSVNTLGSGTYFGPVTGLNGKWTWRNILSWDKNPEGKIGNFYGTFEIVPKPDTCVFECISFLYRRCTQALKSFCPVENIRVNPLASTKTAKIKVASGFATGANGTDVNVGDIILESGVVAGIGDAVKITKDTVSLDGFVIAAPTATKLTVQVTSSYEGAFPTDASITIG